MMAEGVLDRRGGLWRNVGKLSPLEGWARHEQSCMEVLLRLLR